VSAETEVLDAYVIALGCSGVAVRVLEHRARSLQSLFLELTRSADLRDDRHVEPLELVAAES
jgi:hypothetical protein